MKRRGRSIVIELDGPRLSAISAEVGADRVRLANWRTATCPTDVNDADADALLAWASAQLKSWKLGRGRVICAVPRAEIVLKRLSLAGAGAVEEGDRAGIVSLQMGRQLSLSMQDPVVDYVPIGTASESSSLDVIAAALPSSRLAWLERLLKEAGLRLDRIGVRSEGVATLVANALPDEQGAVLGIALGASTTDFVIVEAGELVFARSADLGLPAPNDADDFAERVAVEAKRSWMSYRMTRESADVERVMVLGGDEVSTLVADRCSATLEFDAHTVGAPDFLEVVGDLASSDRLLSLPLVGLLAQQLVGRPTLDFANPRRAPDRSAAVRQRVLAACLGLIVVAGAGYVLAQGELSRLERRRESLLGERNGLRDEYADALRRDARLEHLRQFVGTDVDWIGHMEWLSEAMPATTEALADRFQGSLDADVVFRPRVVERGSRRVAEYAGGSWSHDEVISILLDGRVHDRETADSLRTSLIDSGVYTVDTRGPDEQDRFSFELISRDADPMREAEPEGTP